MALVAGPEHFACAQVYCFSTTDSELCLRMCRHLLLLKTSQNLLDDSVSLLSAGVRSQRLLKLHACTVEDMLACVLQGFDDQISVFPVSRLVGVIASISLGRNRDGTVYQLWATSAPLTTEALADFHEGDVGI